MDDPRLARWIAVIVRRRLPILAATALIVALALALAFRLHLATDLAELLPTDDPAVVATREIQARLGAVVPLQIAIASPSKTANLAYAEALTTALRREPHSLIDHAAYEVHAERAFFEHNWWLYLDAPDLELVREKLTHEVQWRKNPLLVDLDDDRTALTDLEVRIRKRMPAAERFPEGNFMSADGTLVVIMVWPPGTTAGDALVARVRELADALPHPALHVELAGSIDDAIRERHALENDLAWASGLCLALVSLVVVLFYGRLRALPLMAAPALCGIAIALGVGELAFGQLNTSTAFLGSIILGNGINAAIIQLARYEEERRGGASLELAIVRSVTGTIRATGIAALAASAAYASLMLTHFRGFSQFGLIGAVGMVAAWLATIVVLPALVATIDGKRVAGPRRGIAFGAPFGELAGRAPRAIAAVAVALSIVAAVALARYVSDPFEYDLRNLRSVQSAERAQLVARTEAIFGTFTPTILLARTPDQPAEIAAQLRARSDRAGGVVGEIITLDTLLPGPPEAQRAKLAVIAKIRRIVRDPLLSDAALAKLARWDPPDDLAVITPATLPETMTRPLRDAGGVLAPVAIAYRAKRISYWNGRDLIALAAVVRRLELRDHSVVHAGGNPVVFASMVEAIAEDGPIATLASFAAVALLVLVLARRGAAVVLGALVTGVLWLAGAAALADVRVNFLNFIALPLTFGIGVDYAINIYLRYRIDGRIVETLRATGGAVVLCSMTTIIGYASLLLADSQALRSFGKLAILGELSCLSVAVLVMPAWLTLSGRRSRR